MAQGKIADIAALLIFRPFLHTCVNPRQALSIKKFSGGHTADPQRDLPLRRSQVHPPIIN